MSIELSADISTSSAKPDLDMMQQMDAQQIFARSGVQQTQASFKESPEDFWVDEQLGFELDGEGEHLFVQVEKKQLSTWQVQKLLAQWANLPLRSVSYSGLKDTWAHTRQWFSLQLPKLDSDDQPFEHEQCQIVQRVRHRKKLRIGAHSANDFSISLRNIASMFDLQNSIEQVEQIGVPNYFGEQRFGRQRGNLQAAYECLIGGKRCKKNMRSIYTSSIRSFYFNEYLSARVQANNWNDYIEGDTLVLDGSNSFFQPEQWDETLQQRLSSADVHIAGLLIGEGELTLPSVDGLWQDKIDYQQWQQTLEQLRIKQRVRSLRLKPSNFSWQILDERSACVSFSLAAGAFATSVLRELIEIDSEHHRQQL